MKTEGNYRISRVSLYREFGCGMTEDITQIGVLDNSCIVVTPVLYSVPRLNMCFVVLISHMHSEENLVKLAVHASEGIIRKSLFIFWPNGHLLMGSALYDSVYVTNACNNVVIFHLHASYMDKG